MGGGLISDKGDGAGVNDGDGDGDGDGDVWIGWVGDGTDCTTGRKILDESRPCPRPRPPSRPPPPPPRPRPVTPHPGKVYNTTTVGAYKSSKCHIVVFWRLK